MGRKAKDATNTPENRSAAVKQAWEATGALSRNVPGQYLESYCGLGRTVSGATSASMQSGSLYHGEFIFGDTGMTCTAESILGSTAGSSPKSQGSKASFASIKGMRLCRSRMPSQGSVVRMVQVKQVLRSPALPKARKGQWDAVLAADVEGLLGGL